MTALETLKCYTHGKKNTDKVEISVLALNRIIKALSQEPTKREIEREYLFQSLCEDFKKLQAENDDLRKRLEQKSCNDAISRQAALNSLIDNTHLDGYDLAEALDAIENKEKLPPITPSRHVNCEIAEHDGNGCLGYSHYGDDFPIEECLHCPKYTSYEEMESEE